MNKYLSIYIIIYDFMNIEILNITIILLFIKIYNVLKYFWFIKFRNVNLRNYILL